MGEMGLIPGWAVSGLVGSCLPSGQRVEVYTYGQEDSTSPIVYVTDGMNNVAKLKRMKLKAQLNDMKPTTSSSSSASSSSSSSVTSNSYRNCEVFFFCASQDEMMPQDFSRELLIARYGYGMDDGYESDDDSDGESSMVERNGFFSWFRRSDNEDGSNDRIEGEGGSTQEGHGTREGEEGQVLGLQPSPTLPNLVSESDLIESVSVDSVLSTLSFLLLCGDDQRYKNQSENSSLTGGDDSNMLSRKERREIRKIRREANAMHLETMRCERFAILEGPHGTYFGGQRRAVAMYEAFLRNCNLLPRVLDI